MSTKLENILAWLSVVFFVAVGLSMMYFTSLLFLGFLLFMPLSFILEDTETLWVVFWWAPLIIMGINLLFWRTY